MASKNALDLMARTGISFVGTVKGSATLGLTGVTVDDRTVTVRVDQVLHAPDALAHLAGSDITVQLDPGAKVLAPGQQVAFFTNAVAFGDMISVAEVDRLSVAAVAPQMSSALAMGVSPEMDVRRLLEDRQLKEHAAGSEAIVLARVIGLEKAGPMRLAEHDPDWWRATFDVRHIEQGHLPEGDLQVLYANSLDTQWRNAPKPRASQDGLWFLHATKGDLRELAPWVIPDPEDYQPVENLERLRAQG
jgi:hypothetical protein